MTRPRRRWAAVGTAAVTGSCAVAAFWLVAVSPTVRDDVVDAAAALYLVGMTLMAWTGALVVWHRARSVIGWLMVVAGATGVVSRLVFPVAVTALDLGHVAAPFLGWLTNWVWVPAQAAALVLLLRFPDGRLPGPRWRVAEVAVAVWATTATLVCALAPGPLGAEELAPLTNPVGVPLPSPAVDATLSVLFGVLPVLVLVAALAPAVRWPSAPADRRSQLRAVLVAVLLVALSTPLAVASDTGTLLEGLAFLVLPTAIAYAVARHDLWGLDLRRRLDRLRRVREEERGRLQRDLHDSLGPVLGAITMRAEAARNLLAEKHREPAVDELLSAIARDAGAAMVEVRRFVDELGPSALADTDLATALRELTDAVRAGGLDVRLDVDDVGLPAPEVEIAAYRLVAEAVRNVVRHAGATACDIVVQQTGGGLAVTVSDDGTGLRDQPEGVGRRAMRHRVDALGGTLDIADRPDGGVLVAATLPGAAR